MGSGGGVIKSLMDHLPEFSFVWYYIDRAATPGYEQGYLGQGFSQMPIVSDIWNTWRMLSDRKCRLIDNVVDKLLAVDCDGYWIVSHQEGIRVALELARRQNERPVHLTFHDDWAGALCARSNRYRLMSKWAKKITVTAIRSVSTFDVISRGMQEHYQKLTGRSGGVSHRYLSPGLLMNAGKINGDESNLVHVGFVGSLYSKTDFMESLALFNEFFKQRGQQLVFHMWGRSRYVHELPERFTNCLVIHGEKPDEREIVDGLALCSFVYCMYPTSGRLHMFSKTSLPAKLTSYVQAGRPIFGYGPSDSSLAEFLNSTGTGVMWNGSDRTSGLRAIEKVYGMQPGVDRWELARKKYFGEGNLDVMRRSLVH